MNLTLKSVSKEDYKFLYKLLKQRLKDECISHSKLPSYKEHCKFLNSFPYIRNWVIFLDGKPIGNLYETYASEIGLHVLGRHNNVVKEVMKAVLGVAIGLNKKIYFNINPKDKRFKSLLTNNCRLIQNTYENILS